MRRNNPFRSEKLVYVIATCLIMGIFFCTVVLSGNFYSLAVTEFAAPKATQSYFLAFFFTKVIAPFQIFTTSASYNCSDILSDKIRQSNFCLHCLPTRSINTRRSPQFLVTTSFTKGINVIIIYRVPRRHAQTLTNFV